MDRTKLIKQLRKLVQSDIEEGTEEDIENIPSLQQLKLKIPAMVRAAQKVYDEWDASDPDYGDSNVGFGGICHLIVDAILNELDEFECTSLSLDTEVHVMAIVMLREGVFSIDIPPSVYERGGGYNWKKIQNVKFTEHDIDISKISSDPSDYAKEYIDPY